MAIPSERRAEAVLTGLGIGRHEPVLLQRPQQPVAGGLVLAARSHNVAQGPPRMLQVEELQYGEAPGQALHGVLPGVGVTGRGRLPRE